MTPEQTIYLVVISACVLLVGTSLCLALYRWDYRRFFHSPLWTKIIMWLPILLVMLAVINFKTTAAICLSLTIIGLALWEYTKQQRQTSATVMYAVIFMIACGHIGGFFLLVPQPDNGVLYAVIAFSSILSDVVAFFMGSFAGHHHLPRWINSHKSYEGVAGQLIGAFVGFGMLLPLTHQNLSWWLPFIIGVASAFGDIANSIAKRSIGIKDWGKTIPGHGGILDRFSSFSVAIMAASWLLAIAH